MKVRIGSALAPEEGIIVHGCNCLGVMGAGIAAQVAQLYPAAYEVYAEKHKTSGLKLGEITYAQVGPRKFIVNANTQQTTGGWKRMVSYDAVADCFAKVGELANALFPLGTNCPPIIFPAIGAGLAGGSWPVIQAIIEDMLPSDSWETVMYAWNWSEFQKYYGTGATIDPETELVKL